METLYCIAAVVCVAAVYLLTMLLYFFLTKRTVHHPLLADAVVILFALAMSTAVRFAVLVSVPSSVAFRDILRALYEAIGGLTFESADIAAGAAVAPWVEVLFYGVVLYVGLVALSVITAHIGYEKYSYAVYCIVYRPFLSKKRSRTDAYIFTSVTEDSLLLANDIARTYRKNRDPVRNRKCIIIFAGNELEPYDRKNELHREIVAQGYFYFSFIKRKDKDKEIPLVYHLGLRNNFSRNARIAARRICVFAMKLNDKLSGEEAKNSDFVFDEIGAMLRSLDPKDYLYSPAAEGAASGDPALMERTIVDYYILTDEEINYEFYQRELDGMVRARVQDTLNALSALPENRRSALLEEYFASEKIPPDAQASLVKVLCGRIRCNFQMHILNEALLSAHDLVILRREAFVREDAARPLREQACGYGVDKSSCRQGVCGGGNEPCPRGQQTCECAWRESIFRADERTREYRVMVLGFGKTAQQAMNALFVQSTYVDDDGVPSRFVADVYDRAIEERAGLFAYMHPLYYCYDCGKTLAPPSVADPSGRGDGLLHPNTAHAAFYAQCAKDGFGVQDVEESMGFPYVFFHRGSCFDARFMKMLDDEMDKALVRAYVICLGNDENNILMANALIDDYKHERFRVQEPASGFPQTIYVHIRDEKNYRRLNWTGRDAAELERRCGRKLLVIPFGNRESIYRFGRLIDEERPAIFHYLYDNFGSILDKKGTSVSDIIGRALADKNNSSLFFNECCNELESVVKAQKERRSGSGRRGGQEDAVIQHWLSCDAYLRESNLSAYIFSAHYARLLHHFPNGCSSGTAFVQRLACLEKMRWCRFYMANGWIYAEYPKDAVRELRRLAKEHTGLRSHRLQEGHRLVYMQGDAISDERVYDLINVICGSLLGQDDLDPDKARQLARRAASAPAGEAPVK